MTGIVRRMWQPSIKDERCDLELFIEANHVAVHNDTKSAVRVTEEHKIGFAEFWRARSHRPLWARNHIVSSICPQLYGLFLVKLSVALTLIGHCPLLTSLCMSHV